MVAQDIPPDVTSMKKIGQNQVSCTTTHLKSHDILKDPTQLR
ncbi:hypothetical protein X975_17074, partial [Stegodyphus mimosarum]